MNFLSLLILFEVLSQKIDDALRVVVTKENSIYTSLIERQYKITKSIRFLKII